MAEAANLPPEEQREWNHKKGEYPVLKNDPYLIEEDLTNPGVYQKGKDNYPVFSHLENLINVLTSPLPSGIFTQNTSSDYPYPILKHLEPVLPVLTKPLPAGIFRSTDSYPFFPHLEPVLPVLSHPYPVGIFIDNDESDYPFMSHIDDVIPVFTRPYPEGIFIGNSDEPYPFMTHLKPIPIGICYHTDNLSEVSTPPTLDWISDYDFLETSIIEITIPENCIFYTYSFPENTQINRT